jgi:hypothetical protein
MDWVRRGCALGLVALGCAMLCGAARAQGSCTFTDETGKTVTWPNCQDPNEKPDAAKAPAAAPAASGPAKSFPFPGETPVAPAANPDSTKAAQTAAPSPTNPIDNDTQPAGQRFPFPGEDPSGGSKPAPGLQDAGSSGTSPDSGSSSSSSSSSSSGADSSDDGSGVGPLAGDNDPAAAEAAARHARKKLPKVDAQTPSEREQEDLSVAAFYQDDANYKGAYVRAQDAVSIAADDPDAHFALAEAARRLGKLDEAETQYKKCLTLDPVPKEKKAAEKALKEMAGG